MSLICQTCYRSEAILGALGKLSVVQGYYQCADCGSDLEAESIVIFSIRYRKSKGEKEKSPRWLKEHLDKEKERQTELYKLDLERSENSRKAIDIELD